jgi:adenosylcobinamide-phosphate synthase
MSAVALVSGYAADLALGDPRRAHPVAAFGNVALRLERRAYAPSRARGAAYTGALVALTVLVAELAARLLRRAGLGRGAALAAITWVSLGGRSLAAEARGIAALLERGELALAREALPALCGRDPAPLDAPALCRAAVESVAENTSDAVVGALLWGAVAGPAGVAAYRAANTLDAMIGHRSSRYERFGWAAARLDDAMSWPAARVGALLSAACAPVVGGSPRTTWRVLRRDGAAHPSPNAGRMEAAFAGALGVQLGGPLAYGGHAQVRPALGDGRAPGVDDVRRATRLSLAVGAAAAGCFALARAAADRGAAR